MTDSKITSSRPRGLPDLEKLKERCAQATGIALHSPSVSPNTAMQLIVEIERLRAALSDMERRKDEAYSERNRVVSAFAFAALELKLKAGRARTAIEGWSDDWHECVYIDLPTGQVSWHFHDSQIDLIEWLPSYDRPWDGHDTPEKYRRLERFTDGE